MRFSTNLVRLLRNKKDEGCGIYGASLGSLTIESRSMGSTKRE